LSALLLVGQKKGLQREKMKNFGTHKILTFWSVVFGTRITNNTLINSLFVIVLGYFPIFILTGAIFLTAGCMNYDMYFPLLRNNMESPTHF
jgi:hypothetical protein